MELIAAARGGTLRTVIAMDALGRPRPARWAMLPDGTAVVEAAEAIALAHLRPGERDVIAASSAGLGRLVLAALDADARRLVVCVGGTATVDGGLGMLEALGATLRDGDGTGLAGSGGDLIRLASIDGAGVDERLRRCEIVVALDVMSPLAGPLGAAHVFGPQKGATAAQVRLLDDGLARLGALLGPKAQEPGGGAAGGIGAALSWLGAAPAHGADIVMAETGFHAALRSASMVLTGEGKVDMQTAAGKTVARVVAAAVAAGRRVAVIGGAVEDGAAAPLRELGAGAVVAASPVDAPVADALRDGARHVARAACDLLR